MATLPMIPAGGNNSSNILDIVKSGQGILDIFAGKKSSQTTAGTSSSQTMLSPEAMSSMLSQILGGTQGLSAVSSGQKGAGLYNSSTNQLLINDLLTRASGEVATRGAPTVTSNNNKVSTVQQPQMGAGSTLLGLGASLLGNKILKATGVSDKVDSVLSEIFNPKRKAAEASADLADADSGNAVSSFDYSSISSDAGSVGGGAAAGGIENLIGTDAFSGAAATGSGLFDVGVDSTSALTSDIAVDSLSSTATDAFAESAATDGLSSFGFDNFMNVGDASSDAVPGLAVFGAFANLMTGGEWSDFMGDMTSGDSSVICTELHSQGIMSSELYDADVEFSQKYLSPITLRGYRFWAIPAVRLMRKSKILTSIAAFFAIHRAKSLIQSDWIGSIFRKIFEPACYILGLVVYEKDYSSLYSHSGGESV